jgi:uncharacterized protein
MKKEYKKEYNKLIKDIITNEKFLETKNDIHHGSSKYDHLLRVSKCSYTLGKYFNADLKSLTRAALLHDFFIGRRVDKEENSYLNHPNTAAKNAKEIFNITEFEADIIKTHMFHHIILKKILPFLNRKEKAKIKGNKPRSKEAWIVCISDLLVSVMECQRFEFTYIANLSYLILLNFITLKN